MTNSRAATRPARAAAALVAFALLAPGAAAAQGAGPGRARQGASTAPKPQEVVDVSPQPGGFDLPAYTRVQLPNGLVVLLMEHTEVPIVNMRLTIKSGAADDPRAKAGLASVTAELLKAGTGTRSAQQIATDVDFVGGSLEASADFDITTVATQFLAKDVDRQVELLADVTQRPAFAQTEVDRVKQQRLAEIAALPEDPRGFASLQFEAALFEGTTYGHPAVGVRGSVESITRDDVVGFYRSHYTPANAVLAVVGAFKTEEMLAKLKGAFGGWERREPTRVQFGTPTSFSGKRVVLVDSPEASQTQIRIGNVGIARSDQDYYAVQVANTVLGGTFNARLMLAIRVERSLSYSAYSRQRARLNPGPFVIETFTKNETTRETIDVALETLRRFRSAPIPADELNKAKNFILGQFPLGIETVDGLASTVTAIEVYDLPRDYVETYARRVRSLTAADVSAVIQRRFPLDNLLILVVTPQAKTRQQLEGLGPVDVKSYVQTE
jgi:predicted Zn-dependent peptidase